MRKIASNPNSIIPISISVSGQENKSEKTLSKSIKDWEGAVYELEVNYAGFSAKTNTPAKLKKYSKLKKRLNKQIITLQKGSGRMGNQPVGTTDRSASGKDLRQPSPLPYHIRWSRLLLER